MTFFEALGKMAASGLGLLFAAAWRVSLLVAAVLLGRWLFLH